MSEKYGGYNPTNEVEPVDGHQLEQSVPKILYEDESTETTEPVLSPALDIEPSAERLKSSFPVIMAPGFLEDSPATRNEQAQLLEDEVMALVDKGYRTIAALHPRKGKLISPPEGFHLGDPERSFPPEAFQRSIDLLQLIEQKGVDKADIIAHSQGCVDALVAANINPDKFHHIVLSDPAGMIGHDTMIELAARFVRQLPKNSLRQQTDGVVASMRNPIRALKEAYGSAQSDTLDLIYSARQAGITLSLVLDRDDPLFPLERIQHRIADHHYWMELKSGQKIDLPFTDITIMNGHHNSVHDQPEKYIQVFDQHLSAAPRESPQSPGN